jgi:hypothetical protein
VRSSAGPYALDHRHGARSQSRVCSIVGMALDRCALYCKMCARSHVIALDSHGAGNEAMAAKAKRNMWLTRHALDCKMCAQLHGQGSYLLSLLNSTL